MSRPDGLLFYEEQSFPARLVRIAVAVPPLIMTLLVIWQVALGHTWGKRPMSNASLVGWTMFLWLVYVRLVLVRLVTELKPLELVVALRGLWRKRRVPLTDIKSVAVVTFNPVQDYGGYGIRTTRKGTAYIARGTEGVRLELVKGSPLIIGSQRPRELADGIRGAAAPNVL